MTPPHPTLQRAIEKAQKTARGNRVELPLSGGVFTISWLAPDPAAFKKFEELDDVRDELEEWLPLGKADGQCLVVNAKAPHRVAVFSDGFQPLADSLGTFFAETLLAKGEKSPFQKLEKAVERAESLMEREQWQPLVTLLTEALAAYQTLPDPKREDVADNEDALGNGYLMLGYAAHQLGDDALALRAYTFGLAFLNFVCGGNLMQMHLDAQRYDAAIRLGSDLLKEWARKISFDEESAIRGRLLAARWLSGDGRTAQTELKQWCKGSRAKDRTLLLGVLKEALANAPESLAAAKSLI